MKLYSNENFPLVVIQELRVLGYDVLTSYEARQANQRIPDEQVLQFAAFQERVLITINRKDFIRLHRQGIKHYGIVICTFNPNFTQQALAIHQLLLANPSTNNQLLRVNKPNT